MSEIKYWANDPYWTEALNKYGDLKDKGRKKFVIDLKKLLALVHNNDGPARKLMGKRCVRWVGSGRRRLRIPATGNEVNHFA